MDRYRYAQIKLYPAQVRVVMTDQQKQAIQRLSANIKMSQGEIVRDLITFADDVCNGKGRQARPPEWLMKARQGATALPAAGPAAPPADTALAADIEPAAGPVAAPNPEERGCENGEDQEEKQRLSVWLR